MHRIDGPGAVSGSFVTGNPFLAIVGTTITADWLEAHNQELAGLVEGAGLTLDKANNAQVLQAVIDLAILHGGGGGAANGFNLPGGIGPFDGLSGTTLQFRPILGINGATVTLNGDVIEVNPGTGVGQNNTASNQGTGVGVFDNKATFDIQLRTLKAEGGPDVELVLDAATKEIRVRPGAWYRSLARLWKVPGAPAQLVGEGVSDALMPTLRGATFDADDSTGPWLGSSIGSNNDAAGPIEGLFKSFRRDWGVTWAARVRLPDVLTTARWWAGVGAGDPKADDTPQTLNVAAFRRSSSFPDTNLVAYSSNATTEESTGTAVAAVADAEHLLRIELDVAEVRFYVDDVLEATHSVSIPVATTPLGWFHSVTALAAVTRIIKTGRVIWSHA